MTTTLADPADPRDLIDLNRRFFEVPKELTTDLDQYLSVAAYQNKLSTWDDVLAGDCSIILGEAGAGKTTELRQRTKILRDSGQAAFFVPIEALASAGLSGGLNPLDSRPFEEWRSGTATGVFFLDSLDEAKLAHVSLDTALRKLGHELDTTIAHARIVISCRVSDWDIFRDQTAATGALEWKAKASNGPDEHRVGPLRIFGIAPLGLAQVRALALHNKVPEIDAFIKAIEEADAGAFAERPADVGWLASYWGEHGRLGSLRDLVRENAREKLRDPDRSAQARILSSERAWEGARRLAGAATLTTRLSFGALGNGRYRRTPSRDLDPNAVLNDWSSEEIAELLRLPLFDESTYGRVRIHERAVQEYLAADWLRSLLDQGLPRRELDRLIFRHTPHQTAPVLAPHLRAAAAWLALVDHATRRRLAAVAPTVLVGEGDPSGIPVDERRAILTRYADSFRGRRRILDQPRQKALRRFVSVELADDINQMVSDLTLPEEVRCALLTMVAEGGIGACAKSAFQIATNLKEPAAVRAQAVMAATAITNGPSGRPAILALIDEPNIDQSVCGAILRALFPTSITDEEASKLILHSARKPQNRFTGLQYFLEYELDRRCTNERRFSLARGLLNLMQISDRQDLRWLARALVGLLRSGLRGVPDGASLPAEVEDAFAYFETERRHRGGLYLSRKEDLASLLKGRPQMRRQLFWKRVRDAETKKSKRITRYYDFARWHWLLEFGVEDFEWLTSDALKGPDPASRVLAFDALQRMPLFEKDSAQRQILVHRLASESALLAKQLDRRRNAMSLVEVDEERQYYRRIQAIESSRERERDEDKARFESVAEKIRQGEDTNALWELYCVGRPDGQWGEGDTRRIAEYCGERVAAIFLEGLKNYWRRADVPVPQGEKVFERCEISSRLALAGIYLDVGVGLDLSTLEPKHRRLAVRVALSELNHFPAWLDDLAKIEPDETSALLAPLLRQEMEGDGSAPRAYLLDQACRASTFLRRLMAPSILQQLLVSEPQRLDVLVSALECIEGAAVDASALETLAPSRCQAAQGESKRLAIWLVFWINRDGLRAIDYFSAMLASLDTLQATEMVEEVLSRMWDWSDARFEFQLFRIHQNADTMARLIPISFSYVRRVDDLDHESIYSPGRRDHAQSMRDRLLSLLLALPPQDCLPPLRKLAELPDLEELHDYLLVQIEERISADSSCAPWTPDDVASWATSYAHEPMNRDELFRVVLDVLLDIKADYEDGDQSVKGLLSPGDKPIAEKLVQVVLAREMNLNAKGRFVAVPEEEVVDGKFPDIRAHKTGINGAITVEVKVAEAGWSYNELRDSISKQIVGQYLRDPASSFGILAVVSSGKQHGWRMVDGTKLATFADLVAQLKRDAVQIQNEARMKTITVVEIDFH